VYRTLRVAPTDNGVLNELPIVTIAKIRGRTRAARRIVPGRRGAIRQPPAQELTMPGPDAIRADARRFRQLVVSDAGLGLPG
jgi:hypothetical protein